MSAIRRVSPRSIQATIQEINTARRHTLTSLTSETRLKSSKSLAAFADVSATMRSESQSDRAYGLLVSENYFDLLGVKAAHGRTFQAHADQTSLRARRQSQPVAETLRGRSSTRRQDSLLK